MIENVEFWSYVAVFLGGCMFGVVLMYIIYDRKINRDLAVLDKQLSDMEDEEAAALANLKSMGQRRADK
jgi:hypothetical protein